mmetsp:Transcript_3838/g.9606  ORF Transcript_3838/g.9606 Transcript_3838/m.9606 type:complete len:205 (+) Transcript_3838:273-887(+)
MRSSLTWLAMQAILDNGVLARPCRRIPPHHLLCGLLQDTLELLLGAPHTVLIGPLDEQVDLALPFRRLLAWRHVHALGDERAPGGLSDEVEGVAVCDLPPSVLRELIDLKLRLVPSLAWRVLAQHSRRPTSSPRALRALPRTQHSSQGSCLLGPLCSLRYVHGARGNRRCWQRWLGHGSSCCSCQLHARDVGQDCCEVGVDRCP